MLTVKALERTVIGKNPPPTLYQETLEFCRWPGKTHAGGFFGIIGSTSHGLVTDGTWKCSSDLHVGWNSPDFDDQEWPLAKVIANHGDKPWKTIDGIAETAKWIWADNNKDVVYCRLKLK